MKKRVVITLIALLLICMVTTVGVAAGKTFISAKLSTKTLDQGKTVTVSYKLSKKGNVRIRIANAKGNVFAAYTQKNVAANKNKTFKWNGKATKEGNAYGIRTGELVPAGKYTITLAVDKATKKLPLTVKAKPIRVKSIKISPAKLTLEVGAKGTLKAAITPSNATNKSVTWKSDRQKIAVVSSKGVVTAKAVGTAKITVTTEDGEKTHSATVTVRSAGEIKPTATPATEKPKSNYLIAKVNGMETVYWLTYMSPLSSDSWFAIFESFDANAKPVDNLTVVFPADSKPITYDSARAGSEEWYYLSITAKNLFKTENNPDMSTLNYATGECMGLVSPAGSSYLLSFSKAGDMFEGTISATLIQSSSLTTYDPVRLSNGTFSFRFQSSYATPTAAPTPKPTPTVKPTSKPTSAPGQACFYCKGSGEVICLDCGGTKKISCNYGSCLGDGYYYDWVAGERVRVKCSNCGGTGKVECKKCNLIGMVKCPYCK